MTYLKGKPGIFAAIGAFFDHHGAIICNVIGTIVLSFSTNFISSAGQLLDLTRPQTLAEYAGFLLFAGGAYFMARNGARAAKVESENKILNQLVKGLGDDIQNKWRQVLIQIAESVNLDNSGRISIYRHEKDKFIMLGRFSHDPQKQKTGRGFYPLSEGCIGRAYSNGEAFAFDLPDSSSEEYFLKMIDEWSVAPEVVNGFKMKSRSIAAFAIADKRTLVRSLILVFESTDPKVFKKKDLRAACEIFNDVLCGLEQALEPLLPSLHYAQQKGF